MMFTNLVFVLILVGLCLSEGKPQRSIKGTPNPEVCEDEEIKGDWIFEVGKGGYDKTIECNTTGKNGGIRIG